MKRRAFSRAERETMVITQIAIRIQNGQGNGMTTNQLARALDITPSTKFRNILLEMWRAGKLEAVSIPHQGITGKAYVWSLPEGSYQEPKRPKRELVINSKMQKGQLTLW